MKYAIAIIFSILFFCGSAKASVLLSEDFESYELGYIWPDNTTGCVISNEQYFAGSKSVQCTGTNVASGKNIEISSVGQASIFVYTTDFAINSSVSFYISTGTTTLYYLSLIKDVEGKHKFTTQNIPQATGQIVRADDFTNTGWRQFELSWNNGSITACYQSDCYTDDLGGVYEVERIAISAGGTIRNAYFDNLVVSTGGTINQNYDYTLDQESPDFESVRHQSCFYGTPCNLYFSFNELAIGYTMNLLEYESTSTPSYAIASTTIVSNFEWQNKILVPEPIATTTNQVKNYNLLLEAGSYGWIQITGIEIKWWTEDNWQAYLDELSETSDQYCSEENVCSNVSTSSDFLYGFQCGAQRMICWAFVPGDFSRDIFLKSVVSFENSFPFNLYFGMINTMKTAFKQNPNQTTFALPMYDRENNNFEMIDVISSSSIETVLGNETYGQISNEFGHLIWALIAMFILVLILMLIL